MSGQSVSIVSGTFVRLKTDPTRAGILQVGEKVQAGWRMVPVQFPDGQVSWLPEAALEPVQAVPPALADRFAAGRFVDPEWFRRTLARIRVTGRLSDVVYSMEATETDFYAYQFKPVLKFLDSPTDAMLLADEVGLGKTIEAGLIWTELRARLDSNRLLVLCPKTLCEKWRSELDRRFGVDARIVDAAELIQLVSSSRGNNRGFAAIASLQALRPPRGWDDDEAKEETPDTPRARLARLLDEAAEEQPLIDLLVIDEAHHMRNPETMLHRLGELVNAASSHRVFLSATPINLRNRDLHSLLHLIDPDTFEYESTLDELILMNAPIVQARDLLMKTNAPAAAVLERIETARQHELLASSKALDLLREAIKTKPLDPATRAELASRLEQVNQLANYLTRTRRRDVQEFRVKRDAKAPALVMQADERVFYDAVTDEVTDYANERDASERFLLSVPQRLLTSSPAAASEYWAAGASDETDPVEETDQDLEENGEDDRPLVARLAALARKLGMTARLGEVDTKYGLLLAQLRQLWKDEPEAKIIVFSSFKPTLRYLRRRLQTDGIASELLHGSVREPRDTILARFKQSAAAKVLLSSEIGAEGVDLQFCWIVVNYDLPWNPMKLEQRIGRIDRLGQLRPKILILNLIYEGTIDDQIYQRLYMRLGLVERALGEFEAVLGEPIREMTQKLLDPTLTEAQKTEAIERAALVIATQRKIEKDLEDEAGSLVAHGDYILQKIIESRELNRWLQGEDILVYVRDRLRRSFPGCGVETSPPGSETHRIELSPEARDALAGFVARRGLKGTTRLIEGNDEQRYRFTSSVLRGSDGRVENISQMHPIVRFAADLDLRDDAGNRPEPVAATVRRENLAENFKAHCAPGAYVLGIRRWLGGNVAGRATSMARLVYAGARLDSRELLSVAVAEAMAAATAEHGRLLPNIGADERLAKAASLLRAVVLPELDRRFDEFIQQITADLEDRATIRRRALERHRDSKTESLRMQQERHQSRAEELEKAGNRKEAQQRFALARANAVKLRKLQESCNLRFKEIKAQSEVTPEVTDVANMFVEITD